MKQKRWGSEVIIEDNDRYQVKRLLMKAGCACSVHHHKVKRETITCLTGMLLINNVPLEPTFSVTIEPGAVHQMRAVGPCMYLESAYSGCDDDNYRDDLFEPVKVYGGTVPLHCVSSVTNEIDCDSMFPIDLAYRGAVPQDMMAKCSEHWYNYAGDFYKYCKNKDHVLGRVNRRYKLAPEVTAWNGRFFKYKFVKGVTLDKSLDRFKAYLDWMQHEAWCNWRVDFDNDWGEEFYLTRTFIRSDITPKIDLSKTRLCKNWHGDCSFENIICTDSGFVNIDWHYISEGDVYYDLAKLLKSIYFKHDTITKEGVWSSHDLKYIDVLRDWCILNDYTWSHVLKLLPIVVLHMAGSHKGNLGANLLAWGKSLL